MTFQLRQATVLDQPELEALIARSIRALGASDYSGAQIEGALRGAFGVDSLLISDGTYFVAEQPDGAIVGCGGWSRRRTLFGGDARDGRDPGLLDPRIDAARIRAFFVDPGRARQGIGSAILARCEQEAEAAGFSRFELMATLPGRRLYAARGYQPSDTVLHPLGEGLSIPFVPMSKQAAARTSVDAAAIHDRADAAHSATSPASVRSPFAPSRGYIRHTGTPMGWGVFAPTPIHLGEIVEICPMVQVRFPFKELPRELRLRFFGGRALSLPEGVYAMALGYGAIYNHANPANLRYAATEDGQGMVFIADRDIAPGEELTINYNATGGATRSTRDNWFLDNGVELYVPPVA